MKYKLAKFKVLLCLLLIIGCSSTQSSIYKPDDNSSGWKVKVIKKAAINDEFVCTINDSTVVSASFPFIGDNFEKAGMYRGKKVMMNGYRNSTTSKDSNGNTQTNNSYQIRVFIDDKQVDKFDF
ncbi:MAG: hypothetical protein IPL53_24500 [Ignavibacteria bacterium]|nr:hypothetical protein [Ignavibacteria bacterium]